MTMLQCYSSQSVTFWEYQLRQCFFLAAWTCLVPQNCHHDFTVEETFHRLEQGLDSRMAELESYGMIHLVPSVL